MILPLTGAISTDKSMPIANIQQHNVSLHQRSNSRFTYYFIYRINEIKSLLIFSISSSFVHTESKEWLHVLSDRKRSK